MGLFDDILGKVSELTNVGQDAADSVSQVAGDAQAQAEEHIANASEQLPQDPTEVADQFFNNNEK